MQPIEKQVMDIPTMDSFMRLRDQLNLTDRQKQIFVLKYSRGLRNIDIAEELNPPVTQDTVGADVKVIRRKLAAVLKENIAKGIDSVNPQ